MRLSNSKFLAGMAATALGVVGLFAQPSPAPARGQGHARGAHRMANYLNLTPDQQTQAQTFFQEAAQAAKPVRQQLRQDRMALKSAIKTGDTTQINQLTASIGAEQGQLAATRATAMSKLYKTLTPDQQQKFDSFRPGRFGMHRGQNQPNAQN